MCCDWITCVSWLILKCSHQSPTTHHGTHINIRQTWKPKCLLPENESWHTQYMSESRHASHPRHIIAHTSIHVKHGNPSVCHLKISHGTHMHESRHAHEWVTAHIWMSHVTTDTHTKSWHTYEWVTSHKKTQVSYPANESWHTYEWITAHTWMSHGTLMNASRHTWTPMCLSPENKSCAHINDPWVMLQYKYKQI